MDIARALFAVTAAAVVGGCDTGETETAGIDAGGAPVAIVVQGPITGFGSIVVNGVHYEIDRAQISVNGAAAAAADLALGQIVTLSGTRDASAPRGQADRVAFDANVEGPVETIDARAGRLVVLGTPVTTNATTVIDLGSRPPAIASLARGERVQISGFVGAGGAIAATRIAARPDLSRLRVRGTVTNLSRAGARFEINALTVDYRSAAVIEGFPTGEPREGDEVVVEGTRLHGDGRLVAEVLSLAESELENEESAETEIEGLITRFVSAADFDVSGAAVTTSPATVYEDGSAADLKLNVKVEVEGTVDGAGVIVAREIEIKDGGSLVGAP
jgi:uncharacterized protein DUF5666